MYIVSEIVSGEVAETRLPKEQAETLFRKIRRVNASAWIKEDIIESIEIDDKDNSEEHF